jgi:hypothetical protein
MEDIVKRYMWLFFFLFILGFLAGSFIPQITRQTTGLLSYTYGTLKVTSFPSGSQTVVYVDNIKRSLSTPVTLSSLTAGIHSVKIVKSGYYPYEASVTIVSGKTTELVARLTSIIPPCDSYGDVNSDGYVSQVDANQVSQYVLRLANFTAEQKKRADVDSNGKIESVDAMFIAQYSEDLIDTFKICLALTNGKYFIVGVRNETFNLYLANPKAIQDAIDDYYGTFTRHKHVHGKLVRGDGGFNQPWSWHLDPNNTTMAEVSMEICDGTPGMVESHLDYFLDTVKYFCPGGSQIIDILPT